MVKKFFPFDKNYLLERAQLFSQQRLIDSLIKTVKTYYELKINPLGLEDTFTLKVRNTISDGSLLASFYEKLAAIYRFKFGVNQLEFLWDGSDHFSYYEHHWAAKFEEWVSEFCRHDLFIQAVLDLTVFYTSDKPVAMLENRMQFFIEKHLEVKIHKSKGILAA